MLLVVRTGAIGIGPTLVDLAEDDHAWEAGVRVAWDCGVEDINACLVVSTAFWLIDGCMAGRFGYIRMVPCPSAVVGTSW